MRSRLRPIARSVAAFLYVPLLAGQVADWRFWTIADGLTESFTWAISTAPDGRVWLKHGRVGSLNVLDGYSTGSVAAPKNLAERIWATGGHRVSAIDERSFLMEHRDGRWISHEIPVLSAIPIGNDRALLLNAEQVIEYNTRRRTRRVLRRVQDTGLGQFMDMRPSRERNGIWVLGQNGVAQADE